jgi:hypothetical protein
MVLYQFSHFQNRNGIINNLIFPDLKNGRDLQEVQNIDKDTI